MTCDSFQPAVLVVGPAPTDVGGMAAVMRQMTDMRPPAGWRMASLCFTQSSRSGETWTSRIFRHVRQLMRLARCIRRERVAIVHLHTCSAATFWRTVADAWLARLMRARIVLHIHGAMFDEWVAGCAWPYRSLVRGVLEGADAVVALSEGWAQKLARIAPRARLCVIPNAVHVAPAPRVEPSPSLAPPLITVPSSTAPQTPRMVRAGVDRRCRMLMLARMDEWKGVGDLLEACSLLSQGGAEFELILAGPEGTAGDATRLNARIIESGLADRVRYVGPVEGDAKERLLHWADVLVQPSHHEGLPMSVLEGMARRKAIVATRVGALPEVLTGELAQGLVEPHRPKQLAKALARLCGDATLRHRLGELATQVVRERFSMDRFRDALVSLYAKIAPRRPDSHGLRRRPRRAPVHPAAAALDPRRG